MDINWAVSECVSVVRAKSAATSANILVIVLAVPLSSKNTYVALSLSLSVYLSLPLSDCVGNAMLFKLLTKYLRKL